MPGAMVRTSPSAAASRAAASDAYSPVRRRHREVPVCVTWTVPCAMALLCPHLVVLMAAAPYGRRCRVRARARPLGLPVRVPASLRVPDVRPSAGCRRKRFGRSTVACAPGVG
ncbi:hypothetical protein GPN2_13406 [Streptomyces murinus]